MADKGKIKFFDLKKNFGFITVPGAQIDVFVHGNDFSRAGLSPDDVHQDDTVEFESAPSQKGVKVTKIISLTR